MIEVTRPNSKGYCSLGVGVDYIKRAVEQAKLVIAQINENMPRTFGASMIHMNQIDYVMEKDESLPELPQKKLTEEEKKIGE